MDVWTPIILWIQGSGGVVTIVLGWGTSLCTIGVTIVKTVRWLRKYWPPPIRALLKMLLRLLPLPFVLLAVAIGLVLVRYVVPPPTLVRIAFPTSDSKVGPSASVGGTYNSLDGKHLWVVVQPDNQTAQYPQPGVDAANEKWSTNAYFGRPGDTDTGLGFTLSVVLADDGADRVFQDYIRNAAAHDNPGLQTLPNGAVVQDEIHVTRQ